MARTYFVKRAQQRYATKPVIDPETGQQKVSPKMRRGVQMKSKSGRPVSMRLTERDLDRPLPMPKCSKCGNTIEVGQPYKYTEAYHRTIIRCGTCPAPQVWEYSSSLSARLAEIEHNASAWISDASDASDLETARDDLVSEVRSLAEEKEEAAQNIEDGFGHETSQSAELRDIAEQLNSWADEIEGVEFPELPEPEPEECEECGGTGELVNPDSDDEDDTDTCPECSGSGEVTPDDPSDDQMSDWLEEARSALEEQLGACPV